MKDFIAYLLSNNVTEAKSVLENKIKDLVELKLNQVKMRVAAELFEAVGVEVDFVDEELDESVKNVIKTGRAKIIRVRIRKGKVQRRKKFSAVKGYTIRGGKMVRMTALERRHRKVAAKRARFKRRGKMNQALAKRSRAIRRRKGMGLTT